ncbi:phenylalanine--tRNA ligase subunit beta [Candidatus Woesearchaeota archaeon]|nr:phenylalanine--tRNA ligase subunit beta [Candidatus Woesearchaeota archaeon]
MPTITLNKTVFENLVGKKLPLEELKDRISLLGTDLEKIEDEEIVVEIFPNRPDMLSEQGFARAFSSFIGVKTGLRKYEVKSSGQKVIIDKSVAEVRPYTACAIIKKLKFDDEKIREIVQIQEKLHITYGRNRKKCAIGIYPLEKITFPVTYKADAPNLIKFRPLEAEREMTALQILSQHKAGREYAPLLEGLDKFPFFIDAKKEILSLPPIINSHQTGKITETTTEVFIECSGFEFLVLSKCMNIIVTALAEMGGEIYSVELDYSDGKKITPNLTPEKMKLDLNYINKRLGLNLLEKEAVHLLEKMGYGYEKGEVLIPAYRADILHQVDLVEDVAIAYGYEKFTEEIPNVSTIGEEAPAEKFYRKIREILVGFGLLEVKNYHLMMAEELNQKMNLEREVVALKNAVGEYNRDKLAVIFAHEKTDFTEIRQILDGLMSMLGLEFKVKESVQESFIPGRVGEIYIGEKMVGHIGEIHPQVIINWGLAIPVVGLELDLEKVFKEIV